MVRRAGKSACLFDGFAVRCALSSFICAYAHYAWEQRLTVRYHTQGCHETLHRGLMQYLTLEGFLPLSRGRSRRLALDQIRNRQAAYAEDLALDLAILQGRRVLKREP